MLIAAGVFSAACSESAKMTVEIKDAPETEIVVKQQNVNRYDVLDTVTTDAEGRFAYKVKMKKGDPDFIYLYRNDAKLASLLLEAGDRVDVVADTSGNFTVSGSAETEKLQEVEKAYAEFTSKMDSLAAAVSSAADGRKESDRLQAAMADEYTGYYRKCVRYVMEHSKSLTVVPVFYQTVANSFYVFSQDTDALHFRNVSDSLATVYPESKYVKALSREADDRFRQLEMRVRMQTAEQIGFLDIDMPDINGKKIRLSDVDAKAVLLYFWSPEDALQKMFNLDVLKKIYADYKARGLEIYQVAVAADKPSWARVVAAQELGWINVCDGMGQNSPSLRLYNVTQLPTCFLIVDGQLSDKITSDEKSLRKALDSALK